MARFTGNPEFRGIGLDGVEKLLGELDLIRVVALEVTGSESPALPGIDRERFGHRHDGDPGGKALGQRQTVIDALAGKLRAVSGDEDVLIHGRDVRSFSLKRDCRA